MLENLMEKWGPILDTEKAPSIMDPYRKKVLAQLLENTNAEVREQLKRDPYLSMTRLVGETVPSEVLAEAAPTNAMGASSSTAGAGNIDIYDPVLISMIRRSAPMLMAYDVMRRPANGPSDWLDLRPT